MGGPEQDKTKLGWQGSENAAKVASRGFGPTLKVLIALAILFGVAAIAIPAITGPDDGGGTGAVRNCIKRVMADYPECNDQDGGDGSPKRTTLNGVDIGVCRELNNNGCTRR